MYGKSYESKYKGSMVGSGIAVFAVWDYITTMARNGYVEVNPVLLAFTLGGKDQDPKEIEEALEFLQKPDPGSRSKLEDGRRIVKEGEYQYRLVNWSSYNRMRTEEDRREYNRIKQAEWRARQRVVVITETPAEHEFRLASEVGDVAKCDEIAARRPGRTAPAMPMTEIQNELNALYRRDASDHWAYAEESSLAGLMKRPKLSDELREIIGFYNIMPERKYFPQALSRLLSDWESVLDRARQKRPRKRTPLPVVPLPEPVPHEVRNPPQEVARGLEELRKAVE